MLMKKLRKVIWIFTGLFLVGFSILLGPDIWAKFQANQQAGQFLKQVADEKFEAAFERIYFYNQAFDEDVTITKDAAKKSWIARNKSLRTAGTYIKSFDELSIRIDDGWPRGEVNLVMMEDGKEILYKDVHISFSKTDGKWKVSGLYPVEELSWAQAIGGHVKE